MIRDITHFQIELTRIPVIIRSNEGEILKDEKCSTESGYKQCKATILIGPPSERKTGMELLVFPSNTYDTGPLF